MAKIEKGIHYTTAKWKAPNGTEYDNLECTKCLFGTLFAHLMQSHWDKERKHKHNWGQRNPQPVDVSIGPMAVYRG